jgi:hypothetical protein
MKMRMVNYWLYSYAYDIYSNHLLFFSKLEFILRNRKLSWVTFYDREERERSVCLYQGQNLEANKFMERKISIKSG